MSIQLSQAGDAIANNVATGVNFQNALSPATITAWINAPWSTTGTKSLVGLYDEKQRAASGAANTSTAIQLGSKTANTFNVWTWGGGVLVDSTINMAPYNNRWCFIAYTYDGTTHLTYVNGVASGTGTNPQRPGNFDRVYINGYTNGAANETATFQVDTYNYYSRALTANEIMTMFTSMGNRHGILHRCVARYEFDDGVIGSNVTTIMNQTDFAGAQSNLVPVTPAGTARVIISAGYASANLRTVLC